MLSETTTTLIFRVLCLNVIRSVAPIANAFNQQTKKKANKEDFPE